MHLNYQLLCPPNIEKTFDVRNTENFDRVGKGEGEDVSSTLSPLPRAHAHKWERLLISINFLCLANFKHFLKEKKSDIGAQNVETRQKPLARQASGYLILRTRRRRQRALGKMTPIEFEALDLALKAA